VVFWLVKQSSLVGGSWYSEGTCWVHLQSSGEQGKELEDLQTYLARMIITNKACWPQYCDSDKVCFLINMVLKTVIFLPTIVAQTTFHFLIPSIPTCLYNRTNSSPYALKARMWRQYDTLKTLVSAHNGVATQMAIIWINDNHKYTPPLNHMWLRLY
jgi:hypothetical protein